MPNPQPEPLSLIARIERALVLLAYFIELDGEVHVPMFEKFEAELEACKRLEDTKARARRLLSEYSRSGDIKAIGSGSLTLNSGEAARPRDILPQ